jgi:hypothetical protein
MIGAKSFLEGDVRVISVDPHVPYLYIPNNDWNLFSIAMAKVYGTLVC